VHIATHDMPMVNGEEITQPDSLEAICPTRWLTRLFAVIWKK